jgi:DNA-binding NtrC family response regulator/tetratricopeptide (TPR) repeat protein
LAPDHDARARQVLVQADAWLGQQRCRAAANLATRALRDLAPASDLRARLRLLRAEAVGRGGRWAQARAELMRVQPDCTEPLTRARCHELHARALWHDHSLAAAGAALRAAWDSAGSASNPAARVRLALLEAGLEQQAGSLESASRHLASALDVAQHAERADLVALVQHERALLACGQGDWNEAQRAAQQAAECFRGLGDPREHTQAGLGLARVALAAGRAPVAHAALQRARAWLLDLGGDVVAQAEVALALSDLALVEGRIDQARQQALRALGDFALARWRVGQGRARVRLAHALVALGKPEEALRETRRALRETASGAAAAHALAEFTLGRVLLRLDRRAARQAFERSEAGARERQALVHLARLGRVLACSQGRAVQAEADASLEALRRWGDERLLALSLADLGELTGGGVASRTARATGRATQAQALDLHVLAEVSLALSQADGDWSRRVRAALRALRTAFTWKRALWLADGVALELGDGSVAPGACSLAAAQARRERLAALGFEAQAGCEGTPRAFWVRGDLVVAVPAHGTSCWLCIDGPGVAAGGAVEPSASDAVRMGPGRMLALVAHLARLLVTHLPASTVAGGLVADDDPPETPALPGFVGRCGPMRELYAELLRVAASDVAVFVLGETGTGKERVARALHERSRRRQRPFVAVNVASLSDELFEAELFGHARGAFTGAVQAREGLLMQAQGGTLFLDEVADLSRRAQVKLLRLLQEREYRRVGENELRRADVRIISAAHRDLEACVAAGSFREDLLYRLNTIVLRLPALRERGDDVLLLARHFARAAASGAGRPEPQWAPELGAALQAQGWPGNVRQLENEMARLVALAGDGPLRVEDLSPPLRPPAGWAPTTLDHGTRNPATAPAPWHQAKLEFERRFLAGALAYHAGNRSQTADALGLTRQALTSKLQRLGL